MRWPQCTHMLSDLVYLRNVANINHCKGQKKTWSTHKLIIGYVKIPKEEYEANSSIARSTIGHLPRFRICPFDKPRRLIALIDNDGLPQTLAIHLPR